MQAIANHSEELAQQRTAESLYRKMQVMQHQRAAVLGLYNGPAYPFTLTELRALDQEPHSDCMAVLMMDWSPEREVHEMIQGGHHIFQSLIARWGDRT